MTTIQGVRAQSNDHAFPVGFWASGVLALLLGVGCVQTRITEPARSAVEQLLLSTAADRAMQHVDLSIFNAKKVYVETNLFESYDAKYALGTIREALSQAGALLVNDSKSSEITVEARSGALSTDSNESLVGIPKMGLPIPLAGAFSTPEIALYKSQKQYSVAKLALFAYSTQSGAHVFTSGPQVGKAHNFYYQFLGYILYTSTDIPEKKTNFPVK